MSENKAVAIERGYYIEEDFIVVLALKAVKSILSLRLLR
jgi:hypothetical protein